MKSDHEILFARSVAERFVASRHAQEVSSGERFQFGKNWRRFLSRLNETQIDAAEAFLKSMLDVENLTGVGFLDVGSGSGLFSLAARRLGAEVYSFDFDPEAVACTRQLKEQYFPGDVSWRIEIASVLDDDYLRELRKFDVVYSWGVLHHTGAMWRALENVTTLVRNEGRLFVALYNDQGSKSKAWREVKRFYCSGVAGKILAAGVFIPYFVLGGLFVDLLRLQNPLKRFVEPRRARGMSYFRDLFDWIGGYPFEVAKPEEVIEFCRVRGFTLEKIIACGRGLGNNQFVFIRK